MFYFMKVELNTFSWGEFEASPYLALDSLASPSSRDWDWSTAYPRVVHLKSVMTNHSAEAMSCDIIISPT